MNYLQVNEAQHSLFHHKVTKQALIPNTVLAHIPIETLVMIKKNQVSLSNLQLAARHTSVKICHAAFV